MELYKQDVAKVIGVDSATIQNWECNHSHPSLKYYPAIMDFLRYCPYVRPKTWGEKLHLHRVHRGLTFKELAEIVPIDPTTLRRWEKNKCPPLKIYKERVELFMNNHSISEESIK